MVGTKRCSELGFSERQFTECGGSAAVAVARCFGGRCSTAPALRRSLVWTQARSALRLPRRVRVFSSVRPKTLLCTVPNARLKGHAIRVLGDLFVIFFLTECHGTDLTPKCMNCQFLLKIVKVNKWLESLKQNPKMCNWSCDTPQILLI